MTQHKHAGRYECVVKTPIDIDRAEATLTVNGNYMCCPCVCFFLVLLFASSLLLLSCCCCYALLYAVSGGNCGTMHLPFNNNLSCDNIARE